MSHPHARFYSARIIGEGIHHGPFAAKSPEDAARAFGLWLDNEQHAPDLTNGDQIDVEVSDHPNPDGSGYWHPFRITGRMAPVIDVSRIPGGGAS